MSRVTHTEERHCPLTDDDQSEDDEVRECTSPSSTSSIVPFQKPPTERATLCTPTLLQIRLESSSSQMSNEAYCIICLEAMEAFSENASQQLLVSNIPVHLVCSCKIMAHTSCMEEWLQRKLACPICHCSAQLQPRPGQRVLRLDRTYQRLLDNEDTQAANYRDYMRRQYCAQCVQCGCFLSFIGFLAWMSYMYTHLQ